MANQGLGEVPAQTEQGQANNYQGVLEQNKQLNFVDRLYNPDKYPISSNPDGSYSTHKMMSVNIDGTPIAFPTIVYDNNSKKLIELSPEQAIQYAILSGEFIKFKTDEEANDFANNGYKRSFQRFQQ